MRARKCVDMQRCVVFVGGERVFHGRTQERYSTRWLELHETRRAMRFRGLLSCFAHRSLTPPLKLSPGPVFSRAAARLNNHLTHSRAITFQKVVRIYSEIRVPLNKCMATTEEI